MAVSSPVSVRLKPQSDQQLFASRRDATVSDSCQGNAFRNPESGFLSCSLLQFSCFIIILMMAFVFVYDQ